jgi:16S rRNA (cytosine967-C5)-methyltransferase
VWLDAAAGGGGAAAGGAAAGGVIEDALPALQSSLLRQAARYVRPGGRLVYATCSLDPAENGAVAEAFERQVHEIGAARADLGDLAFAPWPFAAGVAGREATRPHHRTLWPHRHDTDGFFVARWRRLEN